MKKGFTLIEVLVASMLMGMLVSVLTMAFNQSAVAWRTGKAGVSQLTEARQQMIWYHYTAARALPHLQEVRFNGATGRWECDPGGPFQKCVIQNAWDDNGGNLYKRGLIRATAVSGVNLFEFEYPVVASGPSSWKRGVNGTAASSVDAITVGVMSAGPNRKWGDDDDISSWPEKK